MNGDELKNAPKLFAENIKVGYTPEYFVMGVSSGAQAQIFALSPAHTKRLKQYLEHELKTFEEQYGTIEAEWDPKIVSPLQRGNPPTDQS
jgi:hypothetical protein